jgi:hypothetical protein
MKLKKIVSYDPATEMDVTYLHSGKRPMKRCGLIPDLFADENGRVFVLRELKQVMMADHPVVKYRGNSLMVRHLILDAWRPGWDQEDVTIVPKDGNPYNNSVSNLETILKGRGRPRNSKLIKQLLAVELVQAMEGNIEATAEELDVSPLFVEQAVETWAPHLLPPIDRPSKTRGRSPVDIETE